MEEVEETRWEEDERSMINDEWRKIGEYQLERKTLPKGAKTLLKGAKTLEGAGGSAERCEKFCLLGMIAYGHRINNKQSEEYLTADVEELPVERARCTASLNTCGRQKARSPHALHQRGSDQRPGSCDSMRWERLLCRETLMFPVRTRRRRGE